MKIYHKMRGKALPFRWMRVPFCALMAVMALGTVGNIENGFISVEVGAVTLAALAAGLAVALVWPERRG